MNHPLSGVITLVTDFGIRDSYVGTMKGVIHRIHRDAVIVDLTHEIHPQDLMEAALVLENCCRFFPEGTVHVAVVDPGVGTRRRPIIVDVSDHLFVGPDNGVFSRILAAQGIVAVREIQNQRYLLPHISDTFHGRDVFAPVAAYLASGVSPADMGPIVTDAVRRDPPQPIVWQDQITGEVIHIDSFGNILTNVSRELFETAVRGKRFKIVVNGKEVNTISRTYEDVERGKALALFGSMDMLEIAIHSGRADRRIGAGKGDPVQIITEPI